MSDEYDISITRACKLMDILEITNEGFWKIFRLIRKDGYPWNHKKVIDDSNRVAVAQKVAHSIPASRLIRFMEEIIWENGKPNNIRCDNGPEFISHEFQSWSKGIFGTLVEVRELTEKWMDYYNNERPHNSLNNLAPMEYRLARTG